MGFVGHFGQGDADLPGIDRYLGDTLVTAVFRLHHRAAQRLAVAHQLVQTLCAARDLPDHPGLQHLPKILQVSIIEQVEKDVILRHAL